MPLFSKEKCNKDGSNIYLNWYSSTRLFGLTFRRYTVLTVLTLN
jgi:hypothetical protein